MSQTIEKEIVRFSHSESIQLVWPDDYIAVDSSYNNDTIGSDQESLENNDYQLQSPKQRQLFRPQVTVNVYSSSSGGSSAGGSGAGGVGGSGSGAGGSGTGGQATVNGGGDGDGDGSGSGTGGIVSLLAAQVADLFKKVDQLSSLQSSSERVMVESGSWTTQDVRPWQRPEQSTNAKILFSKPFKSTPKLITSITGADVSHDANFRVKVYATSITERGFIIHADSWAETKLYSCEVSWMAVGV
ncbi:hypothetical protein ACQKWADRAFT_105478 [Trichoderma austrokoningii]